MKLFNSLTRRVEDFQPKQTEVGIYSCGPTVYDHITIGNMRTYIFDDILRRTLTASGYKLKHVLNITDIDDKTIERSHQLYPDQQPEVALKKLTDKYQKIFLEDAKQLAIDFSQTTLASATDHIPEMQVLINKIAANGYAYSTDDGIYFDTLKYHNADNHAHPYGVLSPTALQGLATQAQRTGADEYAKHEAVDFALWKAAKPGEPKWHYDFSGQEMAGRPGWHIECSAMSAKYLGVPFDIHTGGVDLIFPHHENEIAQTRAATGQLLADFFVHGEHLLVDAQRMGKSLNNFYVVDDLVKKAFDPLAYRLLVLQAHYRAQLNFTWESLEAAQSFLKRLWAWADLRFQPAAWQTSSEKGYQAIIDSVKAALSDDLNTAGALSFIAEAAAEAETKGIDHHHFSKLLEALDKMLGLGFGQRADIDPAAKTLLDQRQQARDQQNWQLSDELRQKLAAAGLDVRDTPGGQIWQRL